jgi:glycosyltransferase involved in cell wall biosynthesis
MKLTAIIPAYNEEKTIGQVLVGVKRYIKNIIVVDDGSTDKTSEVAFENGGTVLNHIINRGVGGAWNTGIKAALLDNADIIITLDADGQHSPDEIPKLIDPIIKGEADFVIGSRFLENQKIPKLRFIGNKFGNFITLALWNARSSDTQSGMRAFSADAAKKIEILTQGMEVCSEMIKEIKLNNLRFKEVPITAIYTKYSLSKGQGVVNGIKTLIKLLVLKITQ